MIDKITRILKEYSDDDSKRGKLFTEVKNIENGLELNMATTTSACANGEDGYSDKPITVYFYDK